MCYGLLEVKNGVVMLCVIIKLWIVCKYVFFLLNELYLFLIWIIKILLLLVSWCGIIFFIKIL